MIEAEDRRQNKSHGEGLAGVVVVVVDEDALLQLASTNDSILQQQTYNYNHLQLVKMTSYKCKTMNCVLQVPVFTSLIRNWRNVAPFLSKEELLMKLQLSKRRLSKRTLNINKQDLKSLTN
jgi:hypothetical protein